MEPEPIAPEAADPDVVVVDAAPAPAWRIAAAVIVDYMPFAVLWAIALRFLVVGPPPPVWVEFSVFLAYEWTLLRHWRTPGVRVMVLARFRVPSDPEAPEGRETVVWVSPAPLLERGNVLSVITGLLFLAEGVHLWAAVLRIGDLPPGLGAIRPSVALSATFLWGALSLRVGRDFLWLRPRARTLGVFMLLVAMAHVGFWPGVWGDAFADALAVHRAATGALLPPDDAAWVSIWFPVGVWITYAVAAVVVTLNRAPFRRDDDEPPADAPQRIYDMPVERAAQVTALVMLLGIIAGWGFVAWADAWGARQDRDSRHLVETTLPRMAQAWDPEALAAVAGGDLKGALETERGRAAFTRYARLGTLKSLDRVEGEAVIRFLPEGKEVTAVYKVEARFANGPAHVDVILKREGERWTIRHFQVASPALARHK